jgi:hypothetical protein
MRIALIFSWLLLSFAATSQVKKVQAETAVQNVTVFS